MNISITDSKGEPVTDTLVFVTLSERNLHTLFQKTLRDGRAGLARQTAEGHALFVTVEENATHYGDRPAGPMRPSLEEAIARLSTPEGRIEHLREEIAAKEALVGFLRDELAQLEADVALSAAHALAIASGQAVS